MDMMRAFVYTMTFANIIVVCAALVLLPWGRDAMIVLGLCLVFEWLVYEIVLHEVNNRG